MAAFCCTHKKTEWTPQRGWKPLCTRTLPLSSSFLLWRVIQQPPTPSQVTLPPVPAGMTGPRNSTDLFSLREALEKAMAPHSSTLAWRIPWTEEPGGVQSMRLWRVRHNWATSLSLFTFMHWRRKWQPTPLFLPGESQGQGSLVGCRLWGHKESGTTERLSSSSSREALLLAQVLLGKHRSAISKDQSQDQV